VNRRSFLKSTVAAVAATQLPALPPMNLGCATEFVPFQTMTIRWTCTPTFHAAWFSEIAQQAKEKALQQAAQRLLSNHGG
jgi:hypothetical protein